MTDCHHHNVYRHASLGATALAFCVNYTAVRLQGGDASLSVNQHPWRIGELIMRCCCVKRATMFCAWFTCMLLCGEYTGASQIKPLLCQLFAFQSNAIFPQVTPGCQTESNQDPGRQMKWIKQHNTTFSSSNSHLRLKNLPLKMSIVALS